MYPARLAVTLIAALATVAGVAGCTGSSGPNPLPATPTSHPDVTITFTSPSSTEDIPNPEQVTPEAEKLLCDMIAPDIANWRKQDATAAEVSFNLTVHDWAARSGGLNTMVVKDRSIVDRIADQTCPDTRRQALDALRIGRLADGLAGFGG
jgi:hypothetical protein